MSSKWTLSPRATECDECGVEVREQDWILRACGDTFCEGCGEGYYEGEGEEDYHPIALYTGGWFF